MLKGLSEVEATLAERGVPFFLLSGDPTETVPKLARDLKAAAGVCVCACVRARDCRGLCAGNAALRGSHGRGRWGRRLRPCRA
jgi:hypothetical protein